MYGLDSPDPTKDLVGQSKAEFRGQGMEDLTRRHVECVLGMGKRRVLGRTCELGGSHGVVCGEKAPHGDKGELVQNYKA